MNKGFLKSLFLSGALTLAAANMNTADAKSGNVVNFNDHANGKTEITTEPKKTPADYEIKNEDAVSAGVRSAHEDEICIYIALSEQDKDQGLDRAKHAQALFHDLPKDAQYVSVYYTRPGDYRHIDTPVTMYNLYFNGHDVTNKDNETIGFTWEQLKAKAQSMASSYVKHLGDANSVPDNTVALNQVVGLDR